MRTSVFLLQVQGRDCAQGYGQVASRPPPKIWPKAQAKEAVAQDGNVTGLMASLPAPEDMWTHPLNCPNGWCQLSGTALHSWLLLLLQDGGCSGVEGEEGTLLLFASAARAERTIFSTNFSLWMGIYQMFPAAWAVRWAQTHVCPGHLLQ